ncbi:MAG: menaquinone reductase iron-sulfur cluster-binding subunit QrcC [Desulfovibrionaceae bacterium]
MIHKEFQVKWGMVVDLDKCTGCGACMVACQVENNIAPMEDASNKLRTLTWMLVYELSNHKDYPDHETAFLPRPCMQCGAPACVPVCPVVATDKNEEGGIVSQIYPRCIGCRYCMAACPYHSRYFNWLDPVFPKGMDKTLTVNTSPRPRGVVEKCNFCHTRLLNAKQRARAEDVDPMDFPVEWYQPACAESCPTGAIKFGDLNNPKHEVHELIKSPNAFRILEKLGTDPQVYYMSRREWVRLQGDNHVAQEKH